MSDKAARVERRATERVERYGVPPTEWQAMTRRQRKNAKRKAAKRSRPKGARRG